MIKIYIFISTLTQNLKKKEPPHACVLLAIYEAGGGRWAGPVCGGGTRGVFQSFFIRIDFPVFFSPS